MTTRNGWDEGSAAGARGGQGEDISGWETHAIGPDPRSGANPWGSPTPQGGGSPQRGAQSQGEPNPWGGAQPQRGTGPRSGALPQGEPNPWGGAQPQRGVGPQGGSTPRGGTTPQGGGDGRGAAYSQAEPPLPPGLNPRGPGGRNVGRPRQQPLPAQSTSPPRPQYAPSDGSAPAAPSASRAGGLPPELDPRGPGGRSGGSGAGGAGGAGGTGRRWSRRRTIRFSLFALVLTLLVVGVGSYFWAGSKLTHANVLVDYAGRPPAGKGTNWLIIGSDSRQGLSKQQQQDLHTGYDTGARTDSMMILHVGDNGNTLMSIPRDSYVTIPAWTDSKGVQHAAAKHKINAAYAEGDGPLLVKTLEFNTGMRIDHYAEIGFSGFVNVVDDLGGIDMCLDKPIVDKASGADLKAGCQTLNGKQSLAFVRERHQEATQDIARMQHQQQFLAALSHKATSMGTLLNPFVLYPTLDSGLSLLTVDNNTGLTDLSSMFFAMKGVKGGQGKTITVPIATANYQTPRDGVAVKWNMTQAQQVFDAFKNDTTVPSFTG